MFKDKPEGQTHYCTACEAIAHGNGDEGHVHTCGREETCGHMILTPTPEHNGGLWCAEKKPCKIHPIVKDFLIAEDTRERIKEMWADALRDIEKFPIDTFCDNPIVEKWWISLVEAEVEKIRGEIENHQFRMDIKDYLPKVKAWQGGYDIPFDEGYAQHKKDVLDLLSLHFPPKDK